LPTGVRGGTRTGGDVEAREPEPGGVSLVPQLFQTVKVAQPAGGNRSRPASGERQNLPQKSVSWQSALRMSGPAPLLFEPGKNLGGPARSMFAEPLAAEVNPLPVTVAEVPLQGIAVGARQGDAVPAE